MIHFSFPDLVKLHGDKPKKKEIQKVISGWLVNAHWRQRAQNNAANNDAENDE